jgi:hypothetical protein
LVAFQVNIFYETHLRVENGLVSAFERYLFLPGQLADLLFQVVGQVTLSTRSHCLMFLSLFSVFDPFDDKFSLFSVFDDIQGVSNVWKLAEAHHVNGFTRVCLFHLSALVIHHKLDPTLVDPRHELVFNFESSSLD